MTRGEDVKILVDYDLFDVNVKGMTGVFLKTDDASGKSLVRFWINGEWGEFSEGQFERVEPGHVPEKNRELISRIKTLEYSY